MMDISLKYLHFNLLHNDKILVCQPDIEASWVGRGVIPPLQALLSAADPHRWVLLRIIQRIIPCITPPYLHHPSPLYYRGWHTYQLSTFQSHRRLKLEMKSARSCFIREILSKGENIQQAKIYLDFNAQACPHLLHTSILFHISQLDLIYTQYPGY